MLYALCYLFNGHIMKRTPIEIHVNKEGFFNLTLITLFICKYAGWILVGERFSGSRNFRNFTHHLA
jgi:hypothetical protein